MSNSQEIRILKVCLHSAVHSLKQINIVVHWAKTYSLYHAIKESENNAQKREDEMKFVIIPTRTQNGFFDDDFAVKSVLVH